MSGFSVRHIDTYEKKIPVYQLQRMCQDKRLVFPAVLSGKKGKRAERVSETLETILLGIALPVIYASERQDGSLLVLDSSDRLRDLMEFLGGRYLVAGLEFYPELNGYGLEQLEQSLPRVTSLIYNYKISFQIIEYTTPKYMHMQVGNYIEKWNFTREQGVRNKLYGERLERLLGFLERNLGTSADFFSGYRLNRQYMMLRILMYRFVFEEEIHTEYDEDMGLQQLLDRTAECLAAEDDQRIVEFADDFSNATKKLKRLEKKAGFDLTEGKGKEPQARILGYLYNVVWICQENGCQEGRGLEKIAFDEQFWEDVNKEKVSFINIRKHYHEIEKRLR